MDERLEKALEFANYRKTIANQRKNIIERMNILRTIQYKGGSFIADEKTISFVSTLINLKKTSAIINDNNKKPIEIDDLQELLETLVSSYTSASLEYKTQIDKLNKIRSIKKLMDW